ncbi:pilus assembly protein TadG-related protein [Rhizorhabdus argentea]|uniref:pilus assembly protein TadG-related protein n=1 Tax=Rhizorhabdus argentea TaxID=1387174 RepID=UPI0030EBC1E4
MVLRRCKRWAMETSGAVAPTIALSMTALIAVGGLAFDYARLATMDSELQSAADQAALAAVTQLDGTPGQCARASAAAVSFVTNNTLFANDGKGAAVTVTPEPACDATGKIRFYQSYTNETTFTAATTATDARFVSVTVEGREAVYALTAIVGALRSGSINATAVAGLASAICKVPPLMLCNPAETALNTDFNVDGLVGKGIVAKSGGGGALAPGNFGFLEVGASPSANNLRDVFGHVDTSFDCVKGTGVNTAPGNMSSVSTAINTRFDIYENGYARNCGPAGCPPALNTVKDLVRPNAPASNNSCNLSGSGWREVDPSQRYLPDPITRKDTTVTAMGHPRDICHAVSANGDCPGGVIGDGNWDRDIYFKVNHGFTTAQWKAAVGANPTRAQTYDWEISSGHLGPRPVGALTSYKAPVCDPAGGVGPPANADRRKVAVAVINCKAEGVNGASKDVKVKQWIDVFLVEPSIARTRTSTDEVYIEVIGKTTTGGNNQPQFVSRDKPYLVE